MSYDVNIQIVPAAAYTGTAFYSFGQKRTLGVRGINKLVNMYAKALLTPAGTDPIDPTYGTQLTNLIGSNVTLSDSQEVLFSSVSDAATWIEKVQSGRSDVPDDERLASAEVTQFILIPDAPGFAAQVLIKNAANQGLTLILPALSVTGA